LPISFYIMRMFLTHSIWDQTFLTSDTMISSNLVDFLDIDSGFLKFLLSPFLWVLKCSKKNLRKWTWKEEKMTKFFVFQPIFNCFCILKSLEKFLFKKLIDSLFHWLFDFLWIFRRFSCLLLGKVVNPNFKIQFFYCSIQIVQTMFCKKFKLDFWVDQWLIPKVELC
jgi:hypothetical protein